MNNVIWKFPLSVVREQHIQIPSGFRALTVQFQHSELMLWAIVDQFAPQLVTRVLIVGTGHAFDPDGWDYVGTVQSDWLVWHVFVPSKDSL